MDPEVTTEVSILNKTKAAMLLQITDKNNVLYLKGWLPL